MSWRTVIEVREGGKERGGGDWVWLDYGHDLKAEAIIMISRKNCTVSNRRGPRIPGSLRAAVVFGGRKI